MPIKLNGKFVETHLDSELIVMQTDSGNFFSVTGIGKEIWPLLDGSRDRDSLIELLCDQFVVERDVVESDVDAFLGQLNEAGLLAGASVRARGVISGASDGVFRGGACPTPECGVAGGHRAHRYGGVCTLQP